MQLTISLASVKKSDIANIAEDIKSAIISGNVDPLEMLVRKKIVEQAIDTAFKDPDVDAAVSDALSKWPKDKATVHGAEIAYSSRTVYEFKDNPEWVRLNASIKELEEKIKSATKAGGSIVSEDGEVSASPVPTKTSSFITVKFQK